MECFHADDEQLYIDPNVCVDCGACITVCPVQAIYDAVDMPSDKEHWLAVNADRARALPLIATKQDPLPTAEARRAELGF